MLNEETANILNQGSTSDNEGDDVSQVSRLLQELSDIREEENDLSNFQNQNRILREIHRRNEETEIVQRKSVESFHDSITSNNLFLILPLIFLLFVSVFVYQICRLKLSYEKGEIDITIQTLESAKLCYIYINLFCVLVVLFWLMFLIIHKLLTTTDDSFSYKNVNFSLEELVYYYPCFFHMIFYYFDKNCVVNHFDAIVLMVLHTFLGFIFIFTTYAHFYYKIKISETQFVSDAEGYLRRIKTYYSLMGLLNFFAFFFIFLLIPFRKNPGLVSLIFSKHLYLFSEIIKMFYTNYMKYNQLDPGYSTNEVFFIRSQYTKSFLDFFISLFLILQFSFGLYVFFTQGNSFIIASSLGILFKCLSKCLIVLSQIIRLRKFLKIAEKEFPRVNFTSTSNNECIICTDIMKCGRKLSCGHYFHLVCLIKWIEKGSPKCPLCRKDIDFNINALLFTNDINLFIDMFSKIKRLVFTLFGIRSITIRIDMNANEPNDTDSLSSTD